MSFVSQPTDTDAWKKMFTSCRNESAEVINAPDLPNDLVGTFYRNGGGKYDIGKEKVIHPFDSDGLSDFIFIYQYYCVMLSTLF